MQEQRRRRGENLDVDNQDVVVSNKRPVKNIVLIIYGLLLLYAYLYIPHMIGIGLITKIVYIFLVPIFIALTYLIIGFLKSKSKRYIGTIILFILYSFAGIPLLFVNLSVSNVPIVSSITSAASGSTNIALCGSDARTGSVSSNSRCDSVGVIQLNASSGVINYVSLPRDAYVYDACVDSYDKITHTSLEGMDCYVDTLESTLDIKIDGYVKAGFQSVIDIVDAVGGITVNVDQSFYGQDIDDNVGMYYFSAGEMHLSGEQALSYARERKSFSDGDYTRAYHQQQVIAAIAKQAFTGGLNNTIALATSLRDVIDTDISVGTMTSMITKLFMIDDTTVNSYVVKGTGSYKDLPHRGLYSVSVQELNQESLNEVISILNQ